MKSAQVNDMSSNMSAAPNWGMAAGGIFGILLGLAVAALLLRALRGKWQLKSKYDERQKAAQGISYRNAFWTVMICLAVWYFLDICDFVLPDSSILLILIIFLGLLVHIVTCIMTDAYMGLNDNPKRFCISFAVLAVCNLALFAVGMDMNLSTTWMSLFASVAIIIVLAVYGIKQLMDRRKDGDEEEE